MSESRPSLIALTEKQAALSQQLSSVSVAGGTALMLLIILSVWGDWDRVGALLLLQVPVTAANVIITRLVFRGRTTALESARLVVNTAGILATSHFAAWALPVWLLQPLVAVSSENFGRRIAYVALIVVAIAQGGLALIEGQPLIHPLASTSLSLGVALISRRRSEIIVAMLQASEQQRVDLEHANAETQDALGRLEQETRTREEMEVGLRQSQKLEAVGRLAAGIAHEINTPIQFVGDSTRFVKDAVADLMRLVEEYREGQRLIAAGTPIAEAQALAAAAEDDADLPYLREHIPKAFERSLEGLDRVATIVRSMKRFAHPDGRTMVPADLDEAIASTLTIARSEYKHVADVDLDLGGLPLVRCHLGELNQVLLNLIVNASQAIADAVGSSDRRGRIGVRTRVDGDEVVIEVSDTGVGIPPEIRDRIFDPFFTTKEVGRGTGQGLTLALAVVHKHGGRIQVESEVGVGTKFTVRLPIASAIGSADVRPLAIAA